MIKKIIIIFIVSFIIFGLLKYNIDKKPNKNNNSLNELELLNNMDLDNIKTYISLKNNNSNPEIYKVKNKVEEINTILKKDNIETPISGILVFKEYNKNEYKQIEQLVDLELNSLEGNSSKYKKEKIDKLIKGKKEELFSNLEKKGFRKKDIDSFYNYAKLDKSKDIDTKISTIEVNYIPEIGEVVSQEFKIKYDEVKAKLSEKNTFGDNSPIPYDVIIKEIIIGELMKKGECNKIEDELDRSLCNSLKNH